MRLGRPGALVAEQNTAVALLRAGRGISLPRAARQALKGDFTFEAWVARTKINRPGSIATLGRWQLGIDGAGRLTLTVRGRRLARSRPIIGDTRWKHVALIRKANRASLVVDGRVLAEASFARTATPNTRTAVAGHAAGKGLNGRMDELALYKVALPVTQLALHARIGRTPAYETAEIATAGDIACSPASDDFNGGAGTAQACQQRATSELLLDPAIDRVLALGDLQYAKARSSEFQASYDPTWGRVKAKTVPVIGNHEYETESAAGYFDYFNGPGVPTGAAGARTEGWHAQRIGSWRVIALNSNCELVDCSETSAQAAFLRAELSSNADRCTMVLVHHPVHSSGVQALTTGHAPLYEAAVAGGADLMLAGHSHNYQRFLPQNTQSEADPLTGMPEIIIGSGGVDLYDLRSNPGPNTAARNATVFGVARLSLDEGSWTSRFVPIAGSSYEDEAAGHCH